MMPEPHHASLSWPGFGICARGSDEDVCLVIGVGYATPFLGRRILSYFVWLYFRKPIDYLGGVGGGGGTQTEPEAIDQYKSVIDYFAANAADSLTNAENTFVAAQCTLFEYKFFNLILSDASRADQRKASLTLRQHLRDQGGSETMLDPRVCKRVAVTIQMT